MSTVWRYFRISDDDRNRAGTTHHCTGIYLLLNQYTLLSDSEHTHIRLGISDTGIYHFTGCSRPTSCWKSLKLSTFTNLLWQFLLTRIITFQTHYI